MVSPATSADPPAPAGENIGRSRGDYDPTLVRRTYSKAMTSAPPGVLPGTADRDKVAANDGGRAREGQRVPTAGVAAIFRKLGAEVKGLGAAWGLAGLRRALFDADRWVTGVPRQWCRRKAGHTVVCGTVVCVF